jgi:preprotein translocase subunit YajC
MNPNLNQAISWAAQQPEAQAPGGGQPIFILLAAIALMFYFLILRPQNRERRQRQKMVDELAKGDSILTTGGIYGTIDGVDKEKQTVQVTVAPKISIKIARSAVATVVAKKGKPKENGK